MIRWGIIGPGKIAARFARSMTVVDDGRIVAVASRSAERAGAFADEFDIAGRYDDVRALVDDPDVDAVYVATPHSRHEADTVRCLEAGKHVLCEKPIALNAAQAGRMIAAAEAGGRFLMEAVWSRFLPSYRALVDLVSGGRIGTPMQVDADFGFRVPVDPAHRLFDPHQGGGALLDLGIYPLQLCTLVLGPVEHVAAAAVLARCLRAATWAPSGANAQAWRFVWARGRHGPVRRHAVADVTFLDRWDEPATDLAG